MRSVFSLHIIEATRNDALKEKKGCTILNDCFYDHNQIQWPLYLQMSQVNNEQLSDSWRRFMIRDTVVPHDDDVEGLR